MYEDMPDPNEYKVRIYCPTIEYEPLERDVTQLIKDKPYTTLVELIKYATRSPIEEYEKEIAKQSLWFIEVWEQTGMSDLPHLSIWALNKEKKPREFYDCVEKYPGEKSGFSLWPTARAKDLFEEESKEKHRLDLYVALYVV